MTLRGVILDIDGTLIDSNDAHAHAWIEAMTEQNYHVDFDKVRPLIGMGGDKVLPEVLGVSKDSSEGKKWISAAVRSSSSVICPMCVPSRTRASSCNICTIRA